MEGVLSNRPLSGLAMALHKGFNTRVLPGNRIHSFKPNPRDIESPLARAGLIRVRLALYHRWQPTPSTDH